MLTKISIMAPQSERKVIELEEGWELMRKGVTKLKNILVGLPEPQFNSRDYMTLCTTIYNMCIQRPHDYSEQLHDWCKTVIEDYIAETVLQSIQEKHSEYMLKELVQRWNSHKVMVRWLRVFHYLDHFFITRRSLPSLKDVGFICFRDLVFEEIKVNAKDIVISFINREREGEHIDGGLLKHNLR
ncbi:hypothetical protein IFM89_035060 [Coptis chinensis]|uniref:Cullin N-terminal domain-containing protein n=1 Tax=Coptis chinensis TaxID=261450 RepID=A0A835H8T2_9MAGN|nr:hypothetical protein IFM89_035060 [Coptis chinensis]